MSKKVLILTIGAQIPPWDKMIQTSLDTWDSFAVDGVENVFFCGEPIKENTDKIIYFNVNESFFTMSKKMVLAFEWALNNKQFDYILRANSSVYIDKNVLSDYIQEFPDNNVFACIEVAATPKWAVGWSYIISRDIVEKIVKNQNKLRNDITDDLALSYLMNELQVPYSKLKMCSIDKRDEGWALIAYGGESFDFTDFKDCNKSKMPIYRVKQDHDRRQDKYIMEQLYNNLAK